VDTVLTSISSLPCLQSFSITFTPLVNTGPAISQLKNIQRLAISHYGECGDLKSYIPDQVHRVIANSPGLTHLDITSGPSYGYYPSLRDLFAKLSKTGVPLQLQHLGLSFWKLPVDTVTIPYLRSLTSLELYGYPLYGDIERCRLWNNLLAEGVQLTELSSEEISDELLRYLVSYSGLKTLRLKSLNKADFADRFFHDVLPCHEDTLETLHLQPRFEGPWCFGRGNADSILKCQKLSVLVMSVEYNLWGEVNAETEEASSDVSNPLVRFFCSSFALSFRS
jgi:hypothetical protein